MKKYTTLSGDRKYIVYSNHGVVLTDLGITGETDCHVEFKILKKVKA